MKQFTDGGPAFPMEGYTNGMSLRDWFAGMALQGIASNASREFDGWDIMVMAAYRIADKMLKIREVENE